MNLLFASSALFLLLIILLPPLASTTIRKAKTIQHESPRLKRNCTQRSEILSPRLCPEKNDTSANISEIKEIVIKLLEKVNEFEKTNNKSNSNCTKVASAPLAKAQTPTIAPATSATSKTSPCTTKKSVKTPSFKTTSLTTKSECVTTYPDEEEQTSLCSTSQTASDGPDDGRERWRRVRTWGPWTAWSYCSVTCGKGRQVRWRHCVADECPEADAEMEEKTCQLPACPREKFLGIF